MNPIIQTMLNWRRLLLLLSISLLGGYHASVMAQTCPSGWTSATGTTYPISATGTATTGYVNNVFLGGADGNVVRADAGIVVNFGQSLAAGGTVEIIASGINTSNTGNFNVSFSTDGINFSTATLKTVPANTTLASYTVTAPQAFQYVKVISAASNYTNFDVVRYQGTYCQAPVVNYADCVSGQSQTWQYIEPAGASGTVGIVPNNVIDGPDGLNTDLTTSAQSVVVKFAKAFAIGDTIEVTGYKYVSTQVGDFTVYTSMDGVNFTALSTQVFTNVSPAFQIFKFPATSTFQYLKVVRSGSGQVTIDAVRVFGKVCISTPAACAAGETAVSNANIYPTTATGTANSGLINNILFGGADGNVVRADAGIVLNFGQSLPAGGQLEITASAINTTSAGNFNVTFSTDGINYSGSTLITIPAAISTNLQTYRLLVPQAFQYAKLVSVASNYTNFDAVSYKGDFCKKAVVNYADCSAGQSQVWRYIEASAASGTSTPTNILKGPDGLVSSIINSTQNVVIKFDKAFATGDTIEVTGYKYTSGQVGDFTVFTSIDGVNFTALPTQIFTSVSPAFEIFKIPATLAFQYLKVERSGFGQVTIDAVRVFGKVCVSTPAACVAGETAVTNAKIYPTAVTGTATAGYVNNVLFGGADGNVVRADAGIVVDFGQTLGNGGQLEIVASGINTTYTGNFNVTFSTDGVNFSTATLITIPAAIGTNLQSYKLIVPQTFRYAKLVPVSGSYTNFDAVSYKGDFCKKAIVNNADCSAGQTQVWRYIEPTATAGASATAMRGADGTIASLTTATQSIVVKFAKALASGDSIVIDGFKYVSSQVGDFTVYTSMDGVNFTAVQTVIFTNNPPLLQRMKVVAIQTFQYVKIMKSGFGQVSIDAVNVYGKACVASSGSCNLAYTLMTPQTATGTVNSGTANNVLAKDGTVAAIYNGQSVVVNFGQSMLAEGDIYVVASSFNTSYAGNFDVYTSTDNVNFTKITTGTIAATNTTLQTYQFHIPIAFQYVKITSAASNYLKIDYISAGGIFCPPCLVTGTVAVTQATCATNGGSNSDAKLVLNTYGGGATKVGYSAGSSYSGSGFSAAMALTTAPMTLSGTLPNPTSLQPYTIRVFQDAFCYKDIVVVLEPKICLTADLSLTVSPATTNGAKGDHLTYTYTLTNAGPDAAPGVTACIVLPSNTKFVVAKTSQGSYDATSTIWDLGTVAVGSQTITLTVEVK